MAIKDVTGSISRITQPTAKVFPIKKGPNAGKEFTSWSVGIQLDSADWHNLKADSEEKVLKGLFSADLGREVKVDDDVKLYLESEDDAQKYWKVTSILPLNVAKATEEQIVEEQPGQQTLPKEAPAPTPTAQAPTPTPVSNYKETDADKFELGMAKNNAAVIVAAIITKDESSSSTWKDTYEAYYWDTVELLYNKGKEVRKEKLGY